MSSPIYNTDTERLAKEINVLLNCLERGMGSDPNCIDLCKRIAPHLIATSPGLFKLITHTSAQARADPAFTNKISLMLSKIKDIQENRISQYDASAEVSGHLSKEYLPPALGNSLP